MVKLNINFGGIKYAQPAPPKTVDQLLAQIEASEKAGRRYIFIKTKSGDLDIRQYGKFNFIERIKNWWSESKQPELASQFIGKALDYLNTGVSGSGIKVEKKLDALNALKLFIHPTDKHHKTSAVFQTIHRQKFHELEMSARQEVVLSLIGAPLVDTPVHFIDGTFSYYNLCDVAIRDIEIKAKSHPYILGEPQDLFTDQDFKVLETLAKSPSPLAAKAKLVLDSLVQRSLLSDFMQKRKNDDAITLYDSRPFLEYKLQECLRNPDPKRATELDKIHTELNEYFAKTHQKGGFQEIEVLVRQDAMLNLLRDPLFGELVHLSKSNPSHPNAVAFTNLCSEAIQDIVTKQKSHPSIHGHPRDLFNMQDITILETLATFASSSLDAKAKALLVPLLVSIKQGIEASNQQLNSLLGPMASRTIDIDLIRSKPVHQLTPQELEMVIEAKTILMNIDLDLGRSFEISLLREHPLILPGAKKILETIIALDGIRGEKIDLAMLENFKKEHNQALIHPKVAIEGGGPTGLLLAITQFQSGADVTLFEKRSTLYDRSQIVRLDPKWMRMLSYYLGEGYYKLFNDDDCKGIIRSDGFGEIATMFLEDELHMRLTKLISLLPHEKGTAPSIERLAAYEMVAVEPPLGPGQKFQVMARYSGKYDMSQAPNENPEKLRQPVDILICAGGKKSPLKEQFLPSSCAVTEAKQYGVCSWLSHHIPNQNPKALDLFQDFRGVVKIDSPLLQNYQHKLLEEFSEDGMMGIIIETSLQHTLMNFVKSAEFSDFVQKAPSQQHVQTRTFENVGLIYLGMEVPDEVQTALKNLDEALKKCVSAAGKENRQQLQDQKNMIMELVQQLWFQTIMERYGLDKTSDLTLEKLDKKFAAIFPVDQYRMHKDHSYSQISKGDSSLLVTAAGDAFSSPHFMRYSGLTGARENIIHLQDYMRAVTHQTRPISSPENNSFLETLKEHGDRTAAFVIDRGRNFLPSKTNEEVTKFRLATMTKLLDKAVAETTDDSLIMVLKSLEGKYFIEWEDAAGLTHREEVIPKAGWLEMQGVVYQSLEQIKLQADHGKRQT